MKRLMASRVAWSACALLLTLAAASVLPAVPGGRALDASNFVFVGATSAIVGGLVASKRPANPVGWLFLAGAGTFGNRGSCDEGT